MKKLHLLFFDDSDLDFNGTELEEFDPSDSDDYFNDSDDYSIDDD